MRSRFSDREGREKRISEARRREWRYRSHQSVKASLISSTDFGRIVVDSAGMLDSLVDEVTIQQVKALCQPEHLPSTLASSWRPNPAVIIKPGGCPHSYFLEQTDQFYSFPGSQYGHGLLHVRCMFLEGTLD